MRFEEFVDTVENIASESDQIMVLGHINIDQNQDNQPWLRPDLKALQPILDRLVVSQGLKQMNKDNTQFSIHQNPSLLDLFLSSDPTKINKIHNVKTGLSDHEGVVCSINCKHIDLKPQFCIVRNYQNMTADKIMTKIDSNAELQSIFTKTDPKRIANILNTELNLIAEELITETKVQNSKPQHRPKTSQESLGL